MSKEIEYSFVHIYMANKHMKYCWSSLIVREVQPQRDITLFIGMAFIKTENKGH